MQTPWSRDPETLFRLKIEKNQKIHDFGHKKRGGGLFFSTILTTPPHLPPQKSGFQVGGGGVWVRSGPKTLWGMHLLDKIMILQGVKLTGQPLGIGYANQPKKAQNGGVCGGFPYIRACLANTATTPTQRTEEQREGWDDREADKRWHGGFKKRVKQVGERKKRLFLGARQNQRSNTLCEVICCPLLRSGLLEVIFTSVCNFRK